ncbi:MAG: M23 family metallopeptidase [Acidimicrobiales bacterium]
MAGRFSFVRLAVCAAALLLIPQWATAAGADAVPRTDWPYQWPVVAPIADPFRAPASPYGAGNRGIEFDTAPGTFVAAAGAGVVTFAGPVAGQRWVTISHPDGVRTSYGPLAEVLVATGRSVNRGEHIATSSSRLHVSARIGDAYVDPAVLFGAFVSVRLVPTPPGLGATPTNAPAAPVDRGRAIKSVFTNARSRLQSSAGPRPGAAHALSATP